MHRALAAAFVAVVVVLSPAAAAAADCDSYNGVCQTPPASVLPTSLERGTGDTAVDSSEGAPRTLPITGGELVLISTAALAALAGGIVLVASGRRRGDLVVRRTS
ncbi:MAG: hypothetical protein ACLGIG_08915 [Actinomycetes bacterium]